MSLTPRVRTGTTVQPPPWHPNAGGITTLDGKHRPGETKDEEEVEHNQDDSSSQRSRSVRKCVLPAESTSNIDEDGQTDTDKPRELYAEGEG